MKKDLLKPYKKIFNLTKPSPAVGFICPACGSEVGVNEIIENKGNIGCKSCLK